MKKTTLKDMKKKNLQLVLKCIAEGNGLSRTELAEASGLSVSTISTLISELLEEGIISEIGEAASTGGRKRIQIAFSGSYGLIAVFHIKKDGVFLRAFDMTVNEISNIKLEDKPLYSNDLLTVMAEAVNDFFCKEDKYCHRLAGVGIVLQDNMNIDDFVVTYSTGVSSAAITLEDAVKTQFKVPVVIDYSAAYTLTGLSREEALMQDENKLFLRIGKTILASVVVNRKPLEINGEKIIDLSPLFLQKEEKPLSFSNKNNSSDKHNNPKEAALMNKVDIYSKQGIKHLAQVLKPICVFFSIKSISFSGEGIGNKEFLEVLSKAFQKEKAPMIVPKLQYEERLDSEIYYDIALRLRNKKLNLI
ncbi:winged helix-turn-helix domain-containing protein [Alloiococcus sp. CFN-8]|uniref:winged helix-turn-helix domain-containing protein n=1 Tax=Alloiococcus sp. CFN-8 TaxID=3416081 RepID=UPI003CF24C5C